MSQNEALNTGQRKRSITEAKKSSRVFLATAHVNSKISRSASG